MNRICYFALLALRFLHKCPSRQKRATDTKNRLKEIKIYEKKTHEVKISVDVFNNYISQLSPFLRGVIKNNDTVIAKRLNIN